MGNELSCHKGGEKNCFELEDELDFIVVDEIQSQNYGKFKIIKDDQQYYFLKSIKIYQLNELNFNLEFIKQYQKYQDKYLLNIIKYDVIQKDHSIFKILIQTNCIYQTLSNLKQQNNEQQIIDICYDVCRGLKTLLKLQRFHENINPQNILISKQQKYQIFDTKLFQSPSQYQLFYLGIQESQQNCYLSPELFYQLYLRIEKPQDYNKEKSDVFSLGLILLELACNDQLSHLEIYNYQNGTIDQELLNQKIQNIQSNSNFIGELLKNMLQLDEKKRHDIQKIINYIENKELEIDQIKGSQLLSISKTLTNSQKDLFEKMGFQELDLCNCRWQ